MRRLGILLAELAALLLTLLMVLLAAVALLPTQAPISLAFLSPYLARALNEEGVPVRIAFDDTVLAFDRQQSRLDIRLLGVSVRDGEGRRLARVPSVGLRLRAAALLRGRLEPEALTLLGPRVRLVRNEAGRLEVALGAEEAEAGEDLLASWTRGEWPGFTRSLSRVEMREASLVIDDRLAGRYWRAHDVDVLLRRGPRGAFARIDAEMLLGNEPGQLSVEAELLGAGQPTSIDVAFRNIAPATVAPQLGLPALAPLRAFELPLSGHASVRLDESWQPLEARFDLTAGAGRLRLPALYAAPVALAGAAAKGRLVGGEVLELEAATIDFGDGKVARFAGTASNGAAGFGIRGEGSFSNAQVADLARLWPESFNAGARRWVIGHVEGGGLDDIRLRLDAAPGELDGPSPRAEAFLLQFKLTDVDCRYWQPMPRLTQAYGSGRIDARSIAIDVDSGKLGALAVSDGRIRIDYGRPGPEVAEIEFLSRGAARDVLTLLEREPLRLASDVGIDPAATAGRAEVRTQLAVPLLADLPARDIGYQAEATLRDFALDGLFGLYDMSQGELTLRVARDGISGQGTLALNGVPMAMNWRYDFGAETAEPSRYQLSGVLDDAGRRALGVDLAPYIAGIAEVGVDLVEKRDGTLEAAGTADFLRARLAVPELGWQKPPGVPAGGTFGFRAGAGEGIDIDRFRVAGQSFEARGHASYAPTRSHIVLDRLRVGDSDLAVDVTLAEGAPTRLKLSGAALDLQPALALSPSSEAVAAEAEVEAPLELQADLGRIVVGERASLTGARAEGRRVGGLWSPLRARGRLNGGPEVAVEMRPEEGRQRLEVTGDDAGRIFSATRLLEGVEGGSFRLEALLPGGEAGELAAAGTVRAEDFRLVRAPVMTKVMSMASLTGVVDLLQGSGIAFHELRLPFSLRPGEIALRDGRAVGPALGFTVEGRIDRAREQVDLHGAIVPAYTLNSALGGIPLIGPLFVGREGEGIFALSYRLQGPAADPTVSVNPLSVLAPGMLRRLVEIFGQPMGAASPDDDEPYPEAQHP